MRTRVRVGVLIHPRLPSRIGEDSGFLGSGGDDGIRGLSSGFWTRFVARFIANVAISGCGGPVGIAG